MDPLTAAPVGPPVSGAPTPARAPRQPLSVGDQEKIAKVAQDFEALLLGHMLKDLRKTSQVAEEPSFQTGFYNDMFDEYLASHLAQSGGIGLGQMLKQALERSAR